MKLWVTVYRTVSLYFIIFDAITALPLYIRYFYFFFCTNYFTFTVLAQLAEAVEYTDCISAEG